MYSNTLGKLIGMKRVSIWAAEKFVYFFFRSRTLDFVDECKMRCEICMGSNYLGSVDNFKLIIVGHFEKVFADRKVRY